MVKKIHKHIKLVCIQSLSQFCFLNSPLFVQVTDASVHRGCAMCHIPRVRMVWPLIKGPDPKRSCPAIKRQNIEFVSCSMFGKKIKGFINLCQFFFSFQFFFCHFFSKHSYFRTVLDLQNYCGESTESSICLTPSWPIISILHSCSTFLTVNESTLLHNY